MRDTYLQGVVKIHEHCGGIVRYVEDFETVGVKWGFDCFGCTDSTIVHEELLYVYEDDLPDGLTKTGLMETPAEDLGELEWNDDWEDWEDAAADGFATEIAEVVA